MVEDEVFEEEVTMKYTKIAYLILFGGFLLWLGSEVLIKGAVGLASKLGVSERIISVSIIAFGTSIPELSTSIIAIMNKEHKISIGNLIGSNIFDMLGIIGLTGLLSPIYISDKALISNDLIWMIFRSLFDSTLGVFPQQDETSQSRRGYIDSGLCTIYRKIILKKKPLETRGFFLWLGQLC